MPSTDWMASRLPGSSVAIRTLAALLVASSIAAATPPNHVLELDGDGDAVRLPPGVLSGLDELTVEAWVRWQRLGAFSAPFGFGNIWQGIFLNNRADTGDLQFYAYLSRDHLELIAVPDIIDQGAWHHITAVATRDSMRLYLDGVLVGERASRPILTSLGPDPDHMLGGAHWPDNDTFAGQLDQVRIWTTARTEAQIRRDMHRRLTGGEPGLRALWHFDRGDMGDSGPFGFDGVAIDNARVVLAELPRAAEQSALMSVRGDVRDEDGRPLPNALVRIHDGGNEIGRARTDGEGRYQVSFRSERIDLSASHGQRGIWREGLVMRRGEVVEVELELRPAIHVAGRLQALDGSPHEGVPVQAVRGAPPAATYTVTSSADGFYRFINLRPGPYRVRVLTPHGPLYYATALQVETEGTGSVADFSFAPFKKGTWKSYSTRDGLTHHGLSSVRQAADGTLWLGSARREVGCSTLTGMSFGD